MRKFNVRWWSTPILRQWKMMYEARDYCGPLWQFPFAAECDMLATVRPFADYVDPEWRLTTNIGDVCHLQQT